MMSSAQILDLNDVIVHIMDLDHITVRILDLNDVIEDILDLKIIEHSFDEKNHQVFQMLTVV